jgi:hypothetical protein
MYESQTLRAELFDNVLVILVLYVSTVPVWTFVQAEFLALFSVCPFADLLHVWCPTRCLPSTASSLRNGLLYSDIWTGMETLQQFEYESVF